VLTHEKERFVMATQPLHSFAFPVSYALVPSASRVEDSEVEDATAEAVEVNIAWGDNTLLVKHLSPPRSFSIGDRGEFPVSADLLGGSARCELVRCVNGVVEVRRGDGVFVALAVGEAATLCIGELTVRVALVRAGRKVEKGLFVGLANGAQRHLGLSFILHAVVIGSLAFFMPQMSADDAEGQDRDQFLTMQKLLSASAEAEAERIEARNELQGEAGGSGERAQAESGKMGATVPVKSAGRWQKEGPKDNAKPELSRAEQREMAKEFGMAGLVAALAMPTAGPTAEWAPLDGKGRDANSFNGLMWASDVGDATGNGGLELFGTGVGGGGKGVGVGLGPVGTLGHGQGECTDADCPGGFGNRKGAGGWGRSSGRLQGTHEVRNIHIGEAKTVVNGRLPPEVIQRTVRANFGRFRACYEPALRANPALTGRVSVKFVIDRTGAVSTAHDGGSDLPDQGVIGCVVRSFSNLSFTQPEGGIVTVTYPILLSPGS
jgi:hypothetical protein